MHLTDLDCALEQGRYTDRTGYSSRGNLGGMTSLTSPQPRPDLSSFGQAGSTSVRLAHACPFKPNPLWETFPLEIFPPLTWCNLKERSSGLKVGPGEGINTVSGPDISFPAFPLRKPLSLLDHSLKRCWVGRQPGAEAPWAAAGTVRFLPSLASEKSGLCWGRAGTKRRRSEEGHTRHRFHL